MQVCAPVPTPLRTPPASSDSDATSFHLDLLVLQPTSATVKPGAMKRPSRGRQAKQHGKRPYARKKGGKALQAEAPTHANPLNLPPSSLDRVFDPRRQEKSRRTLSAVGARLLKAMVWQIVAEDHSEVGPTILRVRSADPTFIGPPMLIELPV